MSRRRVCATCRQWIPSRAYPPETGWGICGAVGMAGAGQPTADGAAAVIEVNPEADGQTGYLATRDGFGCVRHEPKDAERLGEGT